MTGMLTSAHVVDAILALMGLEAVALAALRLLPAGAALRLLLPGAGILVALRAALAGAAWPYVPLALLGALAAHLFDLRGRIRAGKDCQ